MQLMVSRSYPLIEAQTRAEYVARDALFRPADGSFFAIHGRGRQLIPKSESFLDSRDALDWLNEMPDARGHIGSSAKARGEGDSAMTELEVLDRNIDGLKKLLRVAWQDLANPSLPPFEHREARNQIKHYSVDLQRYLRLKEAERGRPRNQFLIGHGLRKRAIRIHA